MNLNWDKFEQRLQQPALAVVQAADHIHKTSEACHRSHSASVCETVSVCLKYKSYCIDVRVMDEEVLLWGL